MAYVYVGTAAQVDAVRTAALLIGHPLHAIWCPPPTVRPWHVTVVPSGGERVLMTWRPGNSGPVLPLGFGVLVAAPVPLPQLSAVLWTTAGLPGLDPFAQAPSGLGYTPVPQTTYLHLRDISVVSEGSVATLTGALPPLKNGFNQVPDPPPWNVGAVLPCGC